VLVEVGAGFNGEYSFEYRFSSSAVARVLYWLAWLVEVLFLSPHHEIPKSPLSAGFLFPAIQPPADPQALTIPSGSAAALVASRRVRTPSFFRGGESLSADSTGCAGTFAQRHARSPYRPSSERPGWSSGRRPRGQRNFRCSSVMGRSLMQAKRRAIRPFSANSQFSLP